MRTIAFKTTLCLFAFNSAVFAQGQQQAYAYSNASSSATSMQQIAQANMNTAVGAVIQTKKSGGEDDERQKVISKSFALGTGDRVRLENQYGSMVIKTWDKKEVKVDITIRTYSDSEKEAQSMIDDINVEAQKQGNEAVFKTNFAQLGNNNRSWWGSGSSNSRHNKRETKVTYIVYMPEGNALSVDQSYGNVVLDDFSGPLNVKVRYGNFNVPALKGENNNVDVQYGSITIGSANKLTLRSRYGGGVKIGAVNTLVLNADYAGVTIGKIRKEANISVTYKGLVISEVEAGFKSLNIRNSYGSVMVSFDKNVNAGFDAEVSYSSFRYDKDRVTVTKSNEDEEKYFQPNKRYEGKIGKGSSSSRVSVRATYQGITFN